MRLISGPPKEVVFGLAQDFAEVAIEIYRLQEQDDPAREQSIGKLKAEGAPTSLSELVDMAGSTVVRQKMGWYRRNQFLGGLQGFCVFLGMPRADAAHLTNLIRAGLR